MVGPINHIPFFEGKGNDFFLMKRKKALTKYIHKCFFYVSSQGLEPWTH